MKILFLPLLLSLSFPIAAQEIVPPIIVDRDNQVISNVRIISNGAPAISVDGFEGVVINDVIIEHQAGPGIQFIDAPHISITNVEITNVGSPPNGENASPDEHNIVGYNSVIPSINGAVLRNGSSGIYLVDSHGAYLSNIVGYNMRGPFPRGQLVQFNRSDNSTLINFYNSNDPLISWPEDNISVYNSVNAIIKNGLIDGNNSDGGSGIMIEHDAINASDLRLTNALVEDIDVINSANLAFAAYPGNSVIFNRTQVKNTICIRQGQGTNGNQRPLPRSGGLLYASADGGSDTRILDSRYFNVCNPTNILWDPDPISVTDLIEEDFIAGQSLSIEVKAGTGLWNGEDILNYGTDSDATRSANNGNLLIESNRDGGTWIGAYITGLPANTSVDVLVNKLESEGTWRIANYLTDLSYDGVYKTVTDANGRILIENRVGSSYDSFQADIRVFSTR